MRAADWLLLILLSILWGATFFFVAVALKALPPLTLVTARVALAAALLAPLVVIAGFRLPSTVSAWRPYVVLALLNNVAPFTLMTYGQTRIASALAAVLNATTPLFTLLIARMFAGEALSAAKLAGVGLGIAGVAVLMGPAALGIDTASAIGMLAVLAGATSYGFAALWMRRWRARRRWFRRRPSSCAPRRYWRRWRPMSIASGRCRCRERRRWARCLGWRSFPPRLRTSSSSAST
jgi:drug/metabolite transporter (DMT)-like permease